MFEILGLVYLYLYYLGRVRTNGALQSPLVLSVL